MYGGANTLYWKSFERQNSTHLALLKHQNTKKNSGIVRNKLLVTVSLDHLVYGRPLIRAHVEINFSPQSSSHTSFPYNTQPLPQSSDLLPRLDLDCPIVNRDDFVGCFHYDCCNVDILSLSQLVGHNDIKRTFLVFVLKVTSFRFKVTFSPYIVH